jgi:hypothetical protein
MIEIPTEIGNRIALVENRYYDSRTGEKLGAGAYEVLRESLYQWAEKQCTNPPKGHKWYDEVYIGHMMLIAHATGDMAIEVAKEGYGTDGFNIRGIMIDAGHRDVLDRTLKGQRWLTPDEVQAKLKGV